MAKYKVGDKVRIVSERPDSKSYVDEMVRFLGKEITISKVRKEFGTAYYYSEDATPNDPIKKYFCKWFGFPGYFFIDEWISGLAEQKKPTDENFSVTIRFCDRMTVAELYKNGRVVKVENARCNPKDKYSMAEGARIAVERLFEKKPEESKPKVGDKFKIVGKTYFHGFYIGEIVTLVSVDSDASRYEDCRGMRQWVYDCDVKPYKENTK